MSLKNLIPISFALVILSLFLPFVSMYSFGFQIISITGYQLGFALDSVLYLQIVALAALVGIILGALNMQSSGLFTTVCGVIGLIALGIYFIELQGVGGSPLLDLSYVPEFGFYLALLFMLIATLLSFFNIQKTASLSGARTQAFVNPGIGSGQVNRPLPKGIPSGPGNIQVNQTMPSPNIPAMHPPAHAPFNQVTEPMGYNPTEARPRNIPQHYQNLAAGHVTGLPKLIGISGQYAGQIIDLSSGPVTIGRDPSIAHLVYMQTNKEVSRKHCTISFDSNRQRFIIEDSSTNGTFLFPQERLQHGKPVQIESGARFFISDPSEQFEVRIE